jgi:hypothetical protein
MGDSGNDIHALARGAGARCVTTADGGHRVLLRRAALVLAPQDGHPHLDLLRPGGLHGAPVDVDVDRQWLAWLLGALQERDMLADTRDSALHEPDRAAAANRVAELELAMRLLRWRAPDARLLQQLKVTPAAVTDVADPLAPESVSAQLPFATGSQFSPGGYTLTFADGRAVRVTPRDLQRESNARTASARQLSQALAACHARGMLLAAARSGRFPQAAIQGTIDTLDEIGAKADRRDDAPGGWARALFALDDGLSWPQQQTPRLTIWRLHALMVMAALRLIAARAARPDEPQLTEHALSDAIGAHPITRDAQSRFVAFFARSGRLVFRVHGPVAYGWATVVLRDVSAVTDNHIDHARLVGGPFALPAAIMLLVGRALERAHHARSVGARGAAQQLVTAVHSAFTEPWIDPTRALRDALADA